MANTKISYLGKKVYIGIDVHKETYSMTSICDGLIVKKVASIPADPAQFAQSILNWFKDAEIHSAYEAGFSGFSLHRELEKAGIKSNVVNAASIEVASNDKVKTDLRDSKKIAEQLANHRLKCIHIPSEAEEARRALTRGREQVVEMRATVSRQIKSKLQYFGLMARNDKRPISNRYLKEIEAKNLASEVKLAFRMLIEQWRFFTTQIAEFQAALKEQGKKDEKLESVYRSVPGIGLITSRTLANELGDLTRFKNERSLYSYTGLTPSEYSSGEHIRRGHISRQGAARIRWLLVEAAWRAIAKDVALKEAFDRIAKTSGKKRAIVAIARKLIGRIRACFRTEKEYAVGTYA